MDERLVTVETCRQVQADMMLEARACPNPWLGFGLGCFMGSSVTLFLIMFFVWRLIGGKLRA